MALRYCRPIGTSYIHFLLSILPKFATKVFVRSNFYCFYYTSSIHLASFLLYFFLQFWAVLHQLLQWEAPTAVHWAHPQIWAGRVWDRGNCSESIIQTHKFDTDINIPIPTQHCSVYFQWETVEYFDNKIICDLIEEKHKGIISILVCTKTPSLCVCLYI